MSYFNAVPRSRKLTYKIDLSIVEPEPTQCSFRVWLIGLSCFLEHDPQVCVAYKVNIRNSSLFRVYASKMQMYKGRLENEAHFYNCQNDI